MVETLFHYTLTNFTPERVFLLIKYNLDWYSSMQTSMELMTKKVCILLGTFHSFKISPKGLLNLKKQNKRTKR